MANLDIKMGSRDAVTGRFNFVWSDVDGDVEFDDTQAHAVMTSVIEERGSYPFDENHGSELRKIRSVSGATPGQAKATAIESLLPLEQSDAIENVVVDTKASTTGIGGGQLGVTVSWSTPSDPNQDFTRDV